MRGRTSTRFHPKRRASTDHKPGPNIARAPQIVARRRPTHRSPVDVRIWRTSIKAAKVPAMAGDQKNRLTLSCFGQILQMSCEIPAASFLEIKLRIAARFSPGILSTTNVQLVHLVLECCSLQSEALCRSALASDSPGGGSQSIDNGLPLGLFETWRG